MLLVVGVFVFALLGVSEVSPENVFNAVGLEDTSNAIATARDGFQKATEFFMSFNAR
jgi:hypothetical protein